MYSGQLLIPVIGRNADQSMREARFSLVTTIVPVVVKRCAVDIPTVHISSSFSRKLNNSELHGCSNSGFTGSAQFVSLLVVLLLQSCLDVVSDSSQVGRDSLELDAGRSLHKT